MLAVLLEYRQHVSIKSGLREVAGLRACLQQERGDAG